MRGIQVDSERFRRLRRARGLSQRELASLAGVGERTVRNAETGRRVRLEFLRYLSIVLGVDVLNVVHDKDELRTALLEQKRVDHILTAIEVLAYQQDESEFLSLMSENVVVNMLGPLEIPFCGEFRGPDGVRTLGDINRESLTYDRPPVFNESRSSGNLAVVSGQDWLRAVPTGKSFTSWWQHIYEFDRGRIVRLDISGNTAVTAQAFQPG